MSEERFTPGPWVNVGGGPSYYDIISTTYDAGLAPPRICRIYKQTEERDANAALIAAAPALLAACETALENLKDRNCEDGETGDALRAAIALATAATEGKGT